MRAFAAAASRIRMTGLFVTESLTPSSYMTLGFEWLPERTQITISAAYKSRMIFSVILKVSSDRLTEYLYRKDVSLSMRDLMLVLKNSVRSVVARVGVEVNGIMTKTLRRALSARTSLRLALFRFDISSFWHICTTPA